MARSEENRLNKDRRFIGKRGKYREAQSVPSESTIAGTFRQCYVLFSARYDSTAAKQRAMPPNAFIPPCTSGTTGARRPRLCLVALPLDLTQGGLQRAVVVDINWHIDFGIVAGFMQIDLAAAHPAFQRFVVPESPANSRLAGAEGDLEGAKPTGGCITAVVFTAATGQSRPRRNASLGRSRRRGSGGTNALHRDPCPAPSRHVDLKLTISIASMDLALHPAAVHQHLHPVVKIVLPVSVVLHGELPHPPQLRRIGLPDLATIRRMDVVRIASNLQDLGVHETTRGKHLHVVAYLETAGTSLRIGGSGLRPSTASRALGLRGGLHMADREHRH